MNNIKKIIGFSSVAGIFLIALATTTNSVMAQSLTTNASNAIGNVSAPQPANQTAERGENVSIALNKTANQTASEVGQNMSNAVGNASQSANQTVSELGTNASTALNKTAESANATLSVIGKNVTDAGKTALNKTVEVAKGIGSGAADVLGNISGEIQQGISGNK
jgi:hypothetical protein